MSLRHTSPKRRRREAEANKEIDALRLVVGCRCEFCGRFGDLEPHHVGGRLGALLDDVRFILLIDRLCHDALHRMAGDDARAIGLALLHHRGRGGVQEFWRATGRNFPDESQVDLWIDRLTLARSA